MKEAVRVNPAYIEYYFEMDSSVYEEAIINRGYIPKKDYIEHNFNLRSNDVVMSYLIKQDPFSILLYLGNNVEEMANLTSFSKRIPWDMLRYFRGSKESL